MILLRQAIDEKLKEEKLDFLHLERSSSSHPYLAGDCGEPIVTFYSISIPKKLTKSERAYVAELITNYISKQKEEILEAIKLKKKLEEKFEKDENLTYDTTWNNSKMFVTYFKDDAFIKVVYDTSKKEHYTNIEGVNLKKLNNYLDKIDWMKTELKRYVKFLEEKKKTKKRLQELQSCNL